MHLAAAARCGFALVAASDVTLLPVGSILASPGRDPLPGTVCEESISS